MVVTVVVVVRMALVGLCNTKTLSHGNKLRDLWPRLIITEAEVLWWLLHKEEKDGEWKLTRC